MPRFRVASDVPKPLVVYDGSCGLCSASVRFIRSIDQKQQFDFISSTDPAVQFIGKESLTLTESSVVLIESNQRWTKSSAVIRIMILAGGLWSLAGMFYIVPAFIRDPVYDFIATHRHRIFRKNDECEINEKLTGK